MNTHLLLRLVFGEQIPAVHRNIINIHFCDNDLLTADRYRGTGRGLHRHTHTHTSNKKQWQLYNLKLIRVKI